MKLSLFLIGTYMGPFPHGWPAPAAAYSPEIAQRSMAHTLELFRLADELGFDWVSVAEHHFAPLSLTPNPMVLAGALTQVVRRARIAILGPTLPILNPIRVAEEFAMLDTMSGGRIIAGLMRGTPNEYVTYTINPAESRERFQEGVEIIRRAWTEPEPFGWEGRYYRYRAVSIWPRPVQQPHPPLYMSGSSPESGEYAAANHLGLGLAFTNVPLAAKNARYYRERAAAHGWEPGSEQIIYRAAVHVASTDQEAAEDLGPGGTRGPQTIGGLTLESAVTETGYYGRDLSVAKERLMPHTLRERVELGELLLGSPESVIAQAERMKQAIGAGVLDLSLAVRGAKMRQALELFGTKVLPRLQEL
ncbi:MAG TPA: LLM class flavin-dependent oxidoreductase [Candidatus Binataceae bacterium]|nr:LLM class flavin-dependent oxidoreductase [Candidatus Binataceae bacterium]